MKYDIIEKKVGENTFTFECASVSRNHGFAHLTKLYKNGFEIAHNSVQYYNRTWESYRYQTVMSGCVRKEMERILKEGLADYKRENKLKQMRSYLKEYVTNTIKNSFEYKELEILLNMVNNANYGTEAEREELESLDKLLKLTEAFVSLRKTENNMSVI